MRMLHSLADVTDPYRLLLCDVWGVVHNGVEAYRQACDALIAARKRGLTVILITNSPRPFEGVRQQMRGLGVPDETYDGIVTSGDVTRTLIAEGPRRIYHLGPERDWPLFDGLDVELVDDFEAAGVVCTGLFDDETETPDDYADMLARFRARNLPFICANPDIVVERGDRLLYCAGALARDYTLLGGRTLIAGKPHKPIYDAALTMAATMMSEQPTRETTLAIGDGVLTDIKGADGAGIPSLFVTAGIHAAEYAGSNGPDPEKIAGFLESHGMAPVAAIERLR